MSRKHANSVEWNVPGWKLDPKATGHSPGIILGVSRDPKSTLRISASKPPREATTFGVLHTLTAGGNDNVLRVPGHEKYCGLSDPACARDAVAAHRTRRAAR